MFSGSMRDRPANLSVNRFPLPRLQPNTPVDMNRFYAEEMNACMAPAGWIDRRARPIPIDDAMAPVAGAGFADWPKQSPGGVSR